ncbi:unnamed protein product, partial [Rotaria magnacalcarata]
ILLSAYPTHINVSAMDKTVSSLFLSETKIELLVNDIFIEQIAKETVYTLYYSQCSPISCTYSITRRSDFIFVMASIIDSLGGMHVALHFICGYFIHFVTNIFKKQTSPTESVDIENVWIDFRFGIDFWAYQATSDIRGRGSAYFTLLSDLCTLSKTTFNNAVQQFLEEVLVSAQVKPQPEFLSQMEIIVEQFEKTTPYRFSCVLQLIRDITHGNTLVSAYSLDWNWWVTNNVTNSTVPMRAAASTELYSYGKRSDCINSGDIYLAFTQQSRLGIPGFHVGCSAVEALLRSTFECLYNQTCVDALQKFSVDNVNYFNASAYVVAMNPTLSSRFSLNNTIVNIVNTRFIEQWNVNISHFEIL